MPARLSYKYQYILVSISHMFIHACMHCVPQDGPLQSPSVILCLEGRKLVALLPELSKTGEEQLHQTLPTEENLRALVEEHNGQLVDLRPGQGVMVQPRVWHAAVNAELCISVNASICSQANVLHVLLASLIWGIEKQGAFQKSGIYGPDFLALARDALHIDCVAASRLVYGQAGDARAELLDRLLLWSSVLQHLQQRPHITKPKCSAHWLKSATNMLEPALILMRGCV